MSALLHHGQPIKKGDRITDFRGTPWEYRGIAAPKVEGKAGKVDVIPWDGMEMELRTFYVTAFPHLAWAES